MTTNDKAPHSRSLTVWDAPTRVFHWSLVALAAAGIVTGYISPEWWMGIHSWAGYGIAALVVFRLVWGVFGSEYSRIANFAYGPAEALRHLRGAFILRPADYIGHNPVGAMMVFALLAVLIGITVSGLLVLGGEENLGPLAGVVEYPLGDGAKVVHEYLVEILMAMIVVHVAGVVVTSMVTGDNLVAAMISGRKTLPAGLPHPTPRKARPLAAALSLGVFVFGAGGLLAALDRLPPTGLQSLPRHEDFRAECSDCHQLYHPSLLPSGSWQGLMDSLDDHFGEDASLDEETARSIRAYLTDYGGEAWDTEAGNRFRVVSPDAPWQISATPYWVRKHGDITERQFAAENVGSKSNCLACHKDAGTGLFEDERITLLKGDGS